MKIYIASDHAGFNLKSQLMAALPDIHWQDLGPHNTDSVDYPDYAEKVSTNIARAEQQNKRNNLLDVLDGEAIGVLICSTGQGMAIKANRNKDVRAALCWNTEMTFLAREHNNANILCMGAKYLNLEEAQNIFNTFIKTKFGGGRHSLRVEKLST